MFIKWTIIPDFPQIKDKEYKILHSGSMTGKVVRVGFHINRFGELESVKTEQIQAGNGQVKQVRISNLSRDLMLVGTSLEHSILP